MEPVGRNYRAMEQGTEFLPPASSPTPTPGRNQVSLAEMKSHLHSTSEHPSSDFLGAMTDLKSSASSETLGHSLC